MLKRTFVDPLGGNLPALERNILKLRAMQMLLVLFYAEDLKRMAVDMIRATDRWRVKMPHDPLPSERIPKGAKNATTKALNALVEDGAITSAERAEIVALIDYRNVIGHEMHNLVADISTERYAREIAEYSPGRFKAFDYEAVERLQHLRSRLSDAHTSHHYIATISMDGLLFRSAERTFLSEIDRLKRKLQKLEAVRHEAITTLNAELSLKGAHFEKDDDYPDHPLQKYDDGRLTQRGAEICYRLYDANKSPMAVAHLLRISLKAAVKRKRKWQALGGGSRPQVDLQKLPHRKFYRKYDD